MSELTDYADAANQLPTLGSLVLYGVAEKVRLDHTALGTLLDANGLSDFKTRPVSDKNVFLRVSSAQARKRVPTNDPEIFENYLVRHVAQTPATATKHIVVERVNSNGKRLDLLPMVSLEFDTNAYPQVTVGYLDDPATGLPCDHDQAHAVGELVARDYLADRGKVNAYGFRDLIRKVVDHVGATTVRSGVYFVPEARMATIANLEAVTDQIDGISVNVIPLIDNSKSREMLKTAFTQDTFNAIDKALSEIDALDHEVPVAKFAALTQKKAALKREADEMAALLETNLEDAEIRMQLYEAKLLKLHNDGRLV